MKSPDQQPSLPAWIFVVTDLALIGAAAAIAGTAARPLSDTAILSIVLCVVAGAVVGLVPLIVRFERQKNEALDERQRALEALARTVSGSAEQLGIAAGGLHEIAEIAQRNLRQAEQLPHKLQEKIAEFQAQLANAADAEKEELERELLALRASESERMDTVSQRIAKSAADWAKLEAATQQHLQNANEALAKLARGTADAIGKAQAAAEQALAQARIEAARSLGQAAGDAARTVAEAKAAALAELETRLAAAAKNAADRIAQELAARVSTPPLSRGENATRSEPPTSASIATPPPAAEPANAPETSSPSPSAPVLAEPVAPGAPAASVTPAADGTDAAIPTPKRTRKPRREEPPVTAPEPPAAPAEPATAESVAFAEPPPVPVERIAEITPVVPATAEPFVPASAVANGTPGGRGRAAAKPDSNLDLDLGPTPEAVAGAGERGLSSDGATRLLVTAYIGIGNRLFIRGDGPGLSWDKGVPLQFVSIGKWRWQTDDATAPIRFKLYKNDEYECAALGTQTLDPGHQQEVTATF